MKQFSDILEQKLQTSELRRKTELEDLQQQQRDWLAAGGTNDADWLNSGCVRDSDWSVAGRAVRSGKFELGLPPPRKAMKSPGLARKQLTPLYPFNEETGFPGIADRLDNDECKKIK